MAKDSAQIRAQIEATQARLEEDLDELGPVLARRLQRARRLAQISALGGFALITRRLLTRRKHEHRRRGRARKGCCSKCCGKKRRR
jgi:hypothetical protein